MLQDLPKFKRTLLKIQYRVRALVTSGWFNNIFLLMIILNTVALAIVYDNMSPEYVNWGLGRWLAVAGFVLP